MGEVIDFNEYKKNLVDKHITNKTNKSELYEYISYFFEMDNVLKSKFTKRK